MIDKGADDQTSIMKSGLSGFTHYRSRYSNSFTAVTDAGVDSESFLSHIEFRL